MKRILWVLVALLVAGAARAGETPAAAGPSMSSLQNLPVVGLQVRGLSPDGMDFGVTEAALADTVTAALQKAGLRVVRGRDIEQLPGAPTLEVTANISRIAQRGHLFIVSLNLRESVKLIRKTSSLVTVPAVTWEAQDAGYTVKPEMVYAKLGELAARFTAEWSDAGAAPAH